MASAMAATAIANDVAVPRHHTIPRGHEIHGVYRLPRGYTLAFVPQHAEVRNIQAAKPDGDNTNDELEEHLDNTISPNSQPYLAV